MPRFARANSAGIMESLKTMANSAQTVAIAKNTSGHSGLIPGTAHHSAVMAATWIRPNRTIHGLRGPAESAIEPSTGENTAITSPAAEAA